MSHMQIRLGVLTATAALAAGCHAAAQKTHVPRVDLQLNSSGNRGYLVGIPPPPGEQRVTREMFGLTVEVPHVGRIPTGGAAPSAESTRVRVSVPPSEFDAVPAEERAAPAGPHDTYVVQKGDSLWSIAAKPEMYGSATRWRVIYDANRELLKSPDRVRPGMKLRIPRGASEDREGSTVFKK